MPENTVMKASQRRQQTKVSERVRIAHAGVRPGSADASSTVLGAGERAGTDQDQRAPRAMSAPTGSRASTSEEQPGKTAMKGTAGDHVVDARYGKEGVLYSAVSKIPLAFVENHSNE